MNTLSEDPKQAVQNYIHEIEKSYYMWYERQTEWKKNWWSILNYLVISASVITTILAALQTSELAFIRNNLTLIQVLLVLVPLIGTAASAFLMQTKALDLYSLRERGREAIQHLLEEGRRRYAMCTNPKDYSELHAYLVEEIRKVEQDQANDFFNFAANSGSQSKGT